MYMSYCRFEGTRMELSACLAEVGDHICHEAEYAVSEGEIENFEMMVESFYNFLQDAQLITEYGELDREALENVCESMKSGQNDW